MQTARILAIALCARAALGAWYDGLEDTVLVIRPGDATAQTTLDAIGKAQSDVDTAQFSPARCARRASSRCQRDVASVWASVGTAYRASHPQPHADAVRRGLRGTGPRRVVQTATPDTTRVTPSLSHEVRRAAHAGHV